MASITDQVIKLQELTQQNLDILSTINESFFTKKDHLYASIGDNKFAIPSFLSLENKINLLAANFENLISAPTTGEAFFNMDGNSRSIEVRSYNAAPAGIVLNNIEKFDIERNNIFKDFVTPVPHINFDVHSISDDITEVLVKKIIPIHDDLVSFFKSNLTKVDEKTKSEVSAISKQMDYKDLYKILSRYELHKDYTEYDTKMSMPIKKSIGNGIYVIEKIINDIVDENLDNYITLQFRSDINDKTAGNEYVNSLKYRLFDDTIEKSLNKGDQLVTFSGNAKMEITDIKYATNTVTVKVLHGEYLNLVESTTNKPSEIPSLSKIRFYSPLSFDDDKYVKVPLEEDRYIYVAIAPLNSRMNIQSSWGVGVMLDAHNLKNSNKESESFINYYKNNVSNIGDTLFEITSIMSNTLTKYTVNEYSNIIKVVPSINPNNIKVVLINSHIENSESVKQIRSAHKQKQEYLSNKEQIQKDINAIEKQLSEVSFEDANGTREALVESLNTLKTKKNNINNNISKLVSEIHNLSSNTEIPLENAKYRIRGYFDYNTLTGLDDDIKQHIKGIRVQYRYKNIDKEFGSAITFDSPNSSGEGFIFSDWNNMTSCDKERIVEVVDKNYVFKLQSNNDNLNEPSFNQIDIPISHGESVDIKLKVVYDFGAPFIHVSSPWSEIVNIPFPSEYVNNVLLMDIVNENNDDIQINKFNNTLNEYGVVEHTSDKLSDQDVTFFHKPENISSGFYTSERRVIPLKDKLQEMMNSINALNEEIHGTSGDSIKVNFKLSNYTYELTPHQTKNVVTEQYSNFLGLSSVEIGDYDVDYDGDLISIIGYINIKNTSQKYSQKLYSLFPGDNNMSLTINSNTNFYLKNNLENYGIYENSAYNPIYIYDLNHYNSDSKTYEPQLLPQTFNQFIYFRSRDTIGNPYYDTSIKYGDSSWMPSPPVTTPGGTVIQPDRITYCETVITDNQLCYNKKYVKYDPHLISSNKDYKNYYDKYMFVYPLIQNQGDLCANNYVSGTYRILNPGEEINVPVAIEFYVPNEGDSIRKTISFDIFPSLYKEPVTYKVTIISKHANEPGDLNNTTSVIKQYVNTVTQ